MDFITPLYFALICGIAFGILSSLAVKNKNRNQLGWFMAGMAFNVFGFLAALIVDKLEDVKKCPDCGEYVKAEARVCRFCHYTFTDKTFTDNKPYWKELNNGLTNTSVESVAISGTNIFAGTDGGGVWRGEI